MKTIIPISENNFLEFFNSKIPVKNEFVSYDTKAKVIGSFSKPTLLQFEAYQKAYDYFNNVLFGKNLPPVILSLRRQHFRKGGYFKPTAWKDGYGNVWSEINLNPKHLNAPAIEVYSILVHEMAHHFQDNFGKPSRSNYHNKQFALIMEKVGLVCSHNGKPGGKKTGQSMSHYIIPNGAFENAFRSMPHNYKLPFIQTENLCNSIVPLAENNKVKNKVKYCCKECNNNVWGRSGMKLLCVQCNILFLENN